MEKNGCGFTGSDLHKWNAILEGERQYTVFLPGTLDENRIGHKDKANAAWHPDHQFGDHSAQNSGEERISSRLTRKYTYEGAVIFQKKMLWKHSENKRLFFDMERARYLRLFMNETEILPYGDISVSTPYSFELTDLKTGKYDCRIISDNSYPKWCREGILLSSAASDECQTNWNGILGYLRIREENPVFISCVRIYTDQDKMRLDAELEIDAGVQFEGELIIRSEALETEERRKISVESGRHIFRIQGLQLKKDVKYWDEFEGNLYSLTVVLGNDERKTVKFGIRKFGDNGKGRLALNDRTVFLRCETNNGIFPEEGHPPMAEERWKEILEKYKAYGVNCIRFHSWCPPEEAFEAADKLGILMMPELSYWDPVNAFGTEESFEYYQRELKAVLRMLANHPSFVMLTFGNELKPGKNGLERMHRLLETAKKTDATRLYAIGSNVSYGQEGCDGESDFYISQRMYDACLRGTYSGMDFGETGLSGYINHRYPGTESNYNLSMDKIRKVYKKPVVSFEVGQYEILPDFREIKTFQGVTLPDNLILTKERAEARGFDDLWDDYVEATGELALIAYREEIEAAMRTRDLSGISLLGLQDFTGQGTALVGMMNSHLQPKPYDFAKPERFDRFFKSQLPLVIMEKYTYETTETLQAKIRIANFGKKDIEGRLRYKLEGGEIIKSGCLGEWLCPKGEITDAGCLEVNLSECKIETAKHLKLTVMIDEIENSYPVWIYSPVRPILCGKIYETKYLDQQAKEILKRGGTVYLSPDSTPQMLPHSIQAQFTTDFWSVGTFTKQEGGMGQFIDCSHPIFREFPTEKHSDWQWWCMAVQRAVILPRRIKTIIAEIDSFVTMRYMAKLFECRCGGGKLLFSSMGLQNLQRYPEARALLSSIYQYMDSEEFVPEQEMSLEEIETLLSPRKQN